MHSRLLLLLTLCLAVFSATAASPGEPTQVAQGFYDKYMRLTDGQAWVMKSDQVTPGFKKVYAKAMKNADYDPIINGQDFPAKGYTAAPASVKGDAATVAMKSREKGFESPIKVHLVRQNGAWLINGVNELQGK